MFQKIQITLTTYTQLLPSGEHQDVHSMEIIELGCALATRQGELLESRSFLVPVLETEHHCDLGNNPGVWPLPECEIRRREHRETYGVASAGTREPALMAGPYSSQILGAVRSILCP